MVIPVMDGIDLMSDSGSFHVVFPGMIIQGLIIVFAQGKIPNDLIVYFSIKYQSNDSQLLQCFFQECIKT
jgi:hypothetical protein